MYSIKPGRGPSLSGAIAGVVIAMVGVLWMIGTLSIFIEVGDDGPPIAFQVLFVGLGVLFVAVGLGSAAYHFFNAIARHRMSIVDVTRVHDEPDPIAQAMGYATSAAHGSDCPSCGAAVANDNNYCSTCGARIDRQAAT